MILAAGRGTRLGPLTAALPKPLMPVANVPVMDRGMAVLRRLGITDVCVNIAYRAQQILDRYMAGDCYGLHLRWSVESEPTGTAGGLKLMERYLQDDVIVVVSGDAMLDLDLAPLVQAHEQHGALATLATITVNDPSQYGVVVTDRDGRITSFQEKPAPGTEISHQANTGIYLFAPAIFDFIPPCQFCDFALDVFPEILYRQLPFYALPLEGYWTDIGNPGDYLQANLDFLEGAIADQGDGDRIGNCLIAADALINGATLERTVVGRGAVIPAGSVLTDCVVWPHTCLDEPVELTRTVLTPQGLYRIHEKEAIPLPQQPAGV
jgi:NDP-sugar pyrophosphorylase family protein